MRRNNAGRAARKRSVPTSEELRALCAEGVRRLQSEHGFRQWLTAMRTLHRYSPWNVLWLLAQREGLTHVASYRRWQRLGYQVRRRERGLTVWVPLRRRRIEADEDEEETPREVSGFRLGHVFDRSQVEPIEGKAKPLEPPRAAALEGDSHAHLLPCLEDLAARLGFAVVREDLPEDMGGYCDPRGHRIALAAGRPANGDVATLIHELCHALGADYGKYGRERCEAIVECATYVVTARAGLDVEARSVPYIAGWSHDDTEAIERDAREIDRLVAQVERGAGLGPAGGERGPSEAAAIES